MFRKIALATTTTLAFAATAALAETDFKALLPQDIQDAGTFRVAATNDGVPPMLFLGDDLTSLEGLEYDLTEALAAVFGLEVEYTTGTFDTLIPAIAAGRADFAVGSIGDLVVRQEQVDFVDYVKAGVGVAVPAGNPHGVTEDINTFCGLKVAVMRGTFQEEELNNQIAICEAEGKSLEVQTFSDTNSAVMAIRTGRVDIWSGDNSPVGYAIAQSNGALEQAGELRIIALLGYAVGKEDTQLRDALKAGLDELVANGTYAEIFEKWGQSASAVEEISINDAWL